MVAVPELLLPANEAERLQSLRQCDILPTLQECFFDELVALAAALFQLPVAYVSLIEAELAHYKAHYGLPALPPQPRADVLCAQVIKQGQVVVYHDLLTETQLPPTARAIQNGLANQVRFYAGAPLHMPGQHVIGTLCLVGRQPREFCALEENVLEAIADLVSQAIMVRHHCRSTPALRDDCWQKVQTQARDEVYALGALVRYLAARYGTGVPVPEEILHPVRRRLHDLQVVLHEY